MKRKYVCRDFGRPGCGSIPDEKYTMRFDDIGEEPIYWCTWCGKQAFAIDELIDKAINERPNFAQEFKAAINIAEWFPDCAQYRMRRMRYSLRTDDGCVYVSVLWGRELS